MSNYIFYDFMSVIEVLKFVTLCFSTLQINEMLTSLNSYLLHSNMTHDTGTWSAMDLNVHQVFLRRDNAVMT